MDFLNNINNNTLLICNTNNKNKILLKLSNLKKIINIKIMTINEFLNNYFFSYDDETIYYVKTKYQTTREMALIYLDNLKYIVNTNVNNAKIKFLKELYQDLNNKDLLKYNRLFKNYLKRVDIIVLDINLDKFTLNILNKYNSKYIDIYENKNTLKNIYHFKNIEDEVEYTFNKISELIKKDTKKSNIKLVLLGNEYNKIIKRFSYLYNIEVKNIDKYSLYGTIESKKFLELIKNNISKEELYNYLKPNLDKYLYTCFLNIINKYYFIDNLNDVIDLIEYDLQNTYYKEDVSSNVIEIINLNSFLIDDDMHVFILGFNLENIPKIHKDIDYFNDNLKNSLLLNTSLDNNKLERSKVIKELRNIKNIYVSYKDNTPYNSYLISNLKEDLSLEIKDINLDNNTSNLYNKIKLTKYLDNLLKYSIKDNNVDKLYNTYKDINYLSYDNRFSGINNFKLDKLTLSYSALNNYYQCSFRYYVSNILKLDKYEETFKQFIGNMFHYILSRMYNDDFNLDYEWNNYLKDKEFSKKELFYLGDLKKELENIIKVLNYQYSLTGLTNLCLEKEITINCDNNCYLTGKIDKIMFKESNNNTYISIVDYKTGYPCINMSNLKYGIDMQLPIYVYLTLKSNTFDNPQVIGFYLEKILHENSNNDDEQKNIDNLKLQGYTIDDPYLVSMFDPTYESSEMIKSMKTTKNGFAHYSKVISEEDINKMVSIVDTKIQDAFKEILKGIFTINPKVVKGDNLGCRYCKYNDLCFKTGKDLVYLKDEDNT